MFFILAQGEAIDQSEQAARAGGAHAEVVASSPPRKARSGGSESKRRLARARRIAHVVMSRLRHVLRERGLDVEEVFLAFDTNGDGVLQARRATPRPRPLPQAVTPSWHPHGFACTPPELNVARRVRVPRGSRPSSARG